jgi:DNA-binding FadR family transcriptional regulator
MASTVHDGNAVVNPQSGVLGQPVHDLYDWLRSRSRMGRMRRMEVTPPVSRYEQVAAQLRQRIARSEFPDGATLPSGPELARQTGVSQNMIQRAYEILAREGLIRMMAGSRTKVLPRSSWRVEFEVRLPLDDAGRDKTVAEVRAALKPAAAGHATVSEPAAERSAHGIALAMTVVAADAGGAAIAGLQVARLALGSLPVAVVSAREA